MSYMSVKDKPRAITIPEAAAQLHISIKHCQRQVREGEIRSIRIGRAIRIPIEEIDRILNATVHTPVTSGVPPTST